MLEQNGGYHANIQDSRLLQLMGECMSWTVQEYIEGVKVGDYQRIVAALTQLQGFVKSAEVASKSMVEGSRKEERIEDLQGVDDHGRE